MAGPPDGAISNKKYLLTLLVGVAIGGLAWWLNSRGPNEQQVLDSIETGISLSAFLANHASVDEWFYLFNAYQSERVRYSSFDEAKSAGASFGVIHIYARNLSDVLEKIRSGKLDGSKFTGCLTLRRKRWFNGDALIDLTFVDGKLVRKGLGRMFWG